MIRFGVRPALALMVIVAAGCGGGGAGVSTATDLPPLEFAFKTPTEPLRFKVQSSSETEFRGTGMTSSLSFEWIAQDWVQEEAGISTEVTFEKLRSAMRRGSSISMEPVKEVERLEGFSWRFLRDDTGFEPITEPARDEQFKRIFGQLQTGMTTLDLTAPATPVPPGGSWTLDTELGDGLGSLGTSVTSSSLTATYKGREIYAGTRCAKLEFKGKIELDGEIEGEEGRAHIGGSVRIDGSGYFDSERGFLIHAETKIRTSIKQRPLDQRGKSSGPERGFIQTTSVTTRLVGE
jgi:hypothetical protein